jgi:hypothetical protein
MGRKDDAKTGKLKKHNNSLQDSEGKWALWDLRHEGDAQDSVLKFDVVSSTTPVDVISVSEQYVAVFFTVKVTLV